MHELTKPRPEPYVWVTWISRLLAGETTCLWSAWHKAHYHFAKAPTDFDAAAWQVEHTALLNKVAAEYRADGYAVTVEGQNRFTLAGRVGTIAGKPDIVALKGDDGWVVDTKTGRPRGSDRVQVMLYMWALRRKPALAGVRFRGLVRSPTAFNIINPDEVDAGFVARVGELMREVCGPDEPRKAPSFRECQFCQVTNEDCGDRVETEVEFAGVTEEF